jgi:hypothetical protein
MSTQKPQLPELPLDAWEDTKMTVHLFAQIVGKIRLKMMPRKNHWWSVTLYASPTGLTTHPIPYADGFETFEITLNLLAHRLELVTSRGESEAFPLEQGLSVAEFHRELFDALERYGIRPHILDKPYDLPATKPFSEITEYASYQPEYGVRRALLAHHAVGERSVRGV